MSDRFCRFGTASDTLHKIFKIVNDKNLSPTYRRAQIYLGPLDQFCNLSLIMLLQVYLHSINYVRIASYTSK